MEIPKQLILLGLLGAALLISIIGLAIPRWWYSRCDNMYSGLWKNCRVMGSKTDCAIENSTSELELVQAFELMGMLMTLGALVCVIRRKYGMKDSMILHRAIMGLPISGGAMMLIGCIVYSAELVPEKSAIGPGFALCIVAGILAGVAGVLHYVVKEDEPAV